MQSSSEFAILHSVDYKLILLPLTIILRVKWTFNQLAAQEYCRQISSAPECFTFVAWRYKAVSAQAVLVRKNSHSLVWEFLQLSQYWKILMVFPNFWWENLHEDKLVISFKSCSTGLFIMIDQNYLLVSLATVCPKVTVKK